MAKYQEDALESLRGVGWWAKKDWKTGIGNCFKALLRSLNFDLWATGS